MSAIHLHLLGGVQLSARESHGERLIATASKPLALLAYLAVAGADGRARRSDTLLGAPSRSVHQKMEMFHTSHHASAAAPRGFRGGKRGISSLRSLSALTLVGGILAFGPAASRGALPVVQPNPNIEPAGILHDGVLTVALEAKESRWWLHGPNHSPMTIAAFAEPGKPPLVPGPFVRAVVGTEIRILIRNSLAKPVTFLVPGSIHGADDRAGAMDSIVIAPGDMQTFTSRASVAGNYMYRATVPGGASKVEGMAALLAGAIVVDTARADTPPHDRVLVILATQDSAAVACADTVTRDPLGGCVGRRFTYTINGRSWPNTERLHASVGDSLHWRVINASNQVHPMHLHGFYYRVDTYHAGGANDGYFRPAPGQMVVTQLMRGTSTMSITWSPDRPGNWLFHCHLALHTTPDSLSAQLDDPQRREMNGLVLGTIVAARPGVVAAGDRAPVRHLRLIAERVSPLSHETSLSNMARPSPPWLGAVPSMHFVLEEHGRRIDTGKDFSPQLDLMRGEPVAITIVNHLDEPTSVHWHGIEVENSYMDGVPGFSGDGRQLTPAIAPGDSFVARFTPPRAGTFMYHAHSDELREDVAGLEGALIVHDPGASSPGHDHVFFLKGDLGNPEHPIEIDGQTSPDTLVLQVGRAERLRLVNLATVNAIPLFSLTAQTDSAATMVNDTVLVRWRPVAKDGFDLPAREQTLRPARQLVSVGETYDFEYTPASRGTLQLEIRGDRGQHPLLLRVPIRVER